MSCCEIPVEIPCTKKPPKLSGTRNPGNRAYQAMKPFNGWTKVLVIGVLTLQLCGAAFAQDEKKIKSLGTSLQSPQTSQTGAGRWSTGTAPARTGEADGTGNLQLGGDSRPLYRLNRSDV